MAVDASNRPNDRFGYSVYAGVLFAPPELAEAVYRVREVTKSKRAMLPPHVTVLGTFCDIKSFDEVKRAFAKAATGRGPVRVEFQKGKYHEELRFAGVWAVTSPELQGLHLALKEMVTPLATDAYKYGVHGYEPHMTFWEECPPENFEASLKAARQASIGDGFTADKVALVGRVGTAYGGRWMTVGEFGLGKT